MGRSLGISRWSSSCNWTRASPESVETAPRSKLRSLWLTILVGICIVILVTVVTSLLIVYLKPIPESRTIFRIPTSTPNPSPPPTKKSESEQMRQKKLEDLRKASRLTWTLLNKNNKNKLEAKESNLAEDGIVIPSKMVYTSQSRSNPELISQVPISIHKAGRNGCRTQKYEQVIRREGCESVTISNRKCLGQCGSVWVPGIFESFPVCQPSRTTWKTVTLRCGQNLERRERVSVERVKRCSCMEVESSPSASAT